MKRLIFLLLLIPVLFLLNIFVGSASISPQEIFDILMGRTTDSASSFIIFQHRMPQAVTALFVGAALSVSGLMLQTTLHNPLAGPSVLGISGGASLGVAILVLGGIAHSANPDDGLFVMYIAAFVGAMAVTVLLLVISSMVRSNLILLIVGLLLGYLISAIITTLYALASMQDMQNYVIWGMGDFSSVSVSQLQNLVIPIVILLVMSLLMIKPLNVLQLGDMQAQNLGVNINRTRNLTLFIVGCFTAVTTAYCGPVSFIGLAVPHITRLFTNTSDYRRLLPMTMLTGSSVALLCNLLCVLPNDTLLPLNAVTPLIGVPVIVYVVLKKR